MAHILEAYPPIEPRRLFFVTSFTQRPVYTDREPAGKSLIPDAAARIAKKGQGKPCKIPTLSNSSSTEDEVKNSLDIQVTRNRMVAIERSYPASNVHQQEIPVIENLIHENSGDCGRPSATAETTERRSRQTCQRTDKSLDYVRLDEDKYGYHFGAFVPSENKPVAVISVFLEPIPPVGTDVIEQRRWQSWGLSTVQEIFLHPEFQDQGIGTGLLRYGASHCSSMGATAL
ncbi:hypothetical protein HD554DRAFT_2175187 [Boletus coccyginus]|nr:hypothetical protein HD554DRAFT_2175187 [Boletus coccyginus]